MIVTVVNTNPDLPRSVPELRSVEKLAAGRCEIAGTASLEDLENVTKELASSEPSIVAIWGGDGTIAWTLSAMIRNYAERPLPKLCFLPGGTINGTARCLGVKGAPIAVLTRLLNNIDVGTTIEEKRRTLIKLDDHVGFLFGIGIIPNFLDFYNQGKRRGARRALEVLGTASTALLRNRYDQFFKPFPARLTKDGQVWTERKLTNISAGGIECLPFGFKPYIRATEREGAFHLVAHALNARGALRELVNIRRGIGMRDVIQDCVSEVLIETESAERFNFDGDNFPPQTRFELAAGPTVSVLTPA